MKPLTGRQVAWLNLGIALVGIVPLAVSACWFGLDGQRAGGILAWCAPLGDAAGELTMRPMAPWAQWLAVLVGFGVKPAYMLVALGLIIWLWRQPARDLTVLRWGLIWFLLGEGACAANFLLFRSSGAFWEYLHSFGMVAGLSLIIQAFLEGVDYRVVKFSPAQERCAVAGLCEACAKHSAAPCGLKRLFTGLIPALIVLAWIPFPAGFVTTAYQTQILGAPYVYSHLMSSQLFELRSCPVLAMGLLTAAWLVLLFQRHEPVATAKPLFAAGVGFLGFALLRLFLVFTFRDNLMWFDTWEELTELLFVLAVGWVLWVFRSRLFITAAGGRPG